MKIVFICGNAGSGKTTLLDYLSSLGYYCHSSSAVLHNLAENLMYSLLDVTDFRILPKESVLENDLILHPPTKRQILINLAEKFIVPTFGRLVFFSRLRDVLEEYKEESENESESESESEDLVVFVEVIGSVEIKLLKGSFLKDYDCITVALTRKGEYINLDARDIPIDSIKLDNNGRIDQTVTKLFDLIYGV